MSDADTDGNEIESERDEAEAGAGGLRRAMEQRVKSLQDAEDRIRREQAALQEQAKVVFAEREAREQAAADAVPAEHSGAKQRQLAELEQTIASLEQQLAAATAVRTATP